MTSTTSTTSTTSNGSARRPSGTAAENGLVGAAAAAWDAWAANPPEPFLIWNHRGRSADAIYDDLFARMPSNSAKKARERAFDAFYDNELAKLERQDRAAGRPSNFGANSIQVGYNWMALTNQMQRRWERIASGQVPTARFASSVRVGNGGHLRLFA